ncbi:SIS domain-containing protein [Faecalicatena faecalis]|nr:SIS domain-containing protein [Faecalicatena faecalis]
MVDKMEKEMFGKTMDYYREHGCQYTASEIHSQPALWKKTAEMLLDRKQDISHFMEKMMSVEHLRIITTGAGSSAFIGETMQYLLAKEMGIRMENVHTTDIISASDSVLFDVPTLLISYGRSGESPESSAAVKFAEEKIKTVYHIIIVCDGESKLANAAREKDNALVLVMPEGSCDKGFAMTSSVSCMSLATWCIFHYQDIETYAGYLLSLADSAEEQMEILAEKAQQIAENEYRRIIWLGTGALKGLAREACIKSMELSDGFVHAGYDAPMGFRHGPKTVINDETITIHFLSNQEDSLRYDLDFAEEVMREKQGNLVVTVGEKKTNNLISGEDYKVVYTIPEEIPTGSEMGAYINCLLFAQLLSMKKSLQLGYTTDSPSQKGDVNRVVQGVVIYDLKDGTPIE